MRRIALITQTTIGVLLLAALGPAGIAQDAANPVREIDALTQQWTDLAHQKDLLQSEWRTQQPVLAQQLALLEREIAELNALLEETAQQQGAVEQRRLELLEEQTRLEDEQEAVTGSLARASIALHSLQRGLPPPLVAAWEEELPRLDGPLENATEKLRLLVELLGQLDDFEQKLTLNEVVMTLADGQEHVVKQIYLGLSHGWYVTADRRFGAAGIAGPDGWVWTPVADTQPIAAIAGILEQRLDPAFVSIPLELRAPQTSGGN